MSGETATSSFVELHVGDAREVLPSLEPCDQVVTSPPYFRHRSLELPGAIGQGSLSDYLADVAAVVNAVNLNPTGSAWLVMGDTFLHKEQLLIPERLARTLTESGWRLRWRGIWHKSNVRPESAKDRPTIDYESVLLLVKSSAYYSNMDAIREPAEWAFWGAQTSAKARENPLLSPLRRTTPCGSAAGLDVVGVVVVGVVVGLVVVTVVVLVSVDVVVSSPPLSARAARRADQGTADEEDRPDDGGGHELPAPFTSEPFGSPRFWGARGPLARLRITRASLAWLLVARGRPDIRLDEPVVLGREGPSGEPTPAHGHEGTSSIGRRRPAPLTCAFHSCLGAKREARVIGTCLRGGARAGAPLQALRKLRFRRTLEWGDYCAMAHTTLLLLAG